jgi:hypothetical protein
MSDTAYNAAGILLAHPKPEGWVVFLGKKTRDPFIDHWSVPGSGKRWGQESFDAALSGACKDIFKVYPTPLAADWEPVQEIGWSNFFSGDSLMTYLVILKTIPEEMKVPTDAEDLRNRKAYGRWPFGIFEFERVAWFYAHNVPGDVHPGVKKALKELQKRPLP